MPKINKLIIQVRNCRQTQLYFKRMAIERAANGIDVTRTAIQHQRDVFVMDKKINTPHRCLKLTKQKSICSERRKGDMRR